MDKPKDYEQALRAIESLEAKIEHRDHEIERLEIQLEATKQVYGEFFERWMKIVGDRHG